MGNWMTWVRESLSEKLMKENLKAWYLEHWRSSILRRHPVCRGDFWCQCDRTEFWQFEKVKLEVGLELDKVKPLGSLSSLYSLSASWPNKGRTRLVKEYDGDERSIGRGGTCGTISFSGISPVARSQKEVVSLRYALEISFPCYSSCFYWIIVHQMEQMQK